MVVLHKSLFYFVFFFCVFIAILLCCVVCVDVCQFVTMDTSVLDDSDDKTYLIKHKPNQDHQYFTKLESYEI